LEQPHIQHHAFEHHFAKIFVNRSVILHATDILRMLLPSTMDGEFGPE